MCGISGFLSYTHTFTEPQLRSMTQAVHRRGPDAEGVFFDGICGLGHRRLSILDLSASANQPMYSHDNRYVMVYNGEVYNFQEVAQKYGITPRTTSDSEVILEAFAKVGIRCIEDLNGMFAVAIYDTQQKELWICRDRIGIKPVFYYWNNGNFAFGSELKALMALPVPKTIHTPAIAEFLHRGFIPAPHTIYQHIYKLRPGRWMRLSAGQLEEKTYWSAEACVKSNPVSDEATALTQLDELLNQSVKYQLISDVPVGVFLSGGIDSSIVAALAARQVSLPLNTFSIGFQESRHNEAPYAQQVAKHLKSHHYEFMLSVQEAKGLVETMLDIYDEPYADSSGLPTMLVSQLARKQVGVVLTGDGGDELFHGYGMYQWADRLSRSWLKTLRKPLAQLLALGSEPRYQKAASLLQYTSEQDIHSHIFSQEQGFFSYSELKQLVQGINGNAYLSETSLAPDSKGRLLTASEKQSIFDLGLYLPDDLLTKVDRASMYYGLEARVPLLDHHVIEFALNLVPNLKNYNGISKYLLKEVLYKYLPKSLFDRPKQGFSIPLYDWLRTDLRYLLDTYLSDTIVARYGYVDTETVRELKTAFLNGNTYVYNRVWSLMILHRWLVNHA